jgi:hypothetical protein
MNENEIKEKNKPVGWIKKKQNVKVNILNEWNEKNQQYNHMKWMKMK